MHREKDHENLCKIVTVVSFKKGVEKILYILTIWDNDMNDFSVGEKKNEPEF